MALKLEKFNSEACNGLGWVWLEGWWLEAANLLPTVENILVFLASLESDSATQGFAVDSYVQRRAALDVTVTVTLHKKGFRNS